MVFAAQELHQFTLAHSATVPGHSIGLRLHCGPSMRHATIVPKQAHHRLQSSTSVTQKRASFQDRSQGITMITVYSDQHELHAGKAEFHRGQLLPCFETPIRARMILDAIVAADLGAVVSPTEFANDIALHVHSHEYLTFLQQAYGEWRLATTETDAIPHVWCVRRMSLREPQSIFGRLGFYASDASTPITSGTWTAALAGAHVALTAQALVQRGDRAAFALTRPPGHHAAKDYFGGYCYLNNAAIAAQALLNGGAKRVAILDVDYHHGNGTQDIFYDRNDVLYVSLHGDPSRAFPYFLGHSDERGVNEGAGFNWNFPLPDGTAWSAYSVALRAALDVISERDVSYLVVSLGVDTYEADPISTFRLRSDEFVELGQLIAQLKLPTVFVMEGGYAIDALGTNVVNVLTGFE